MMLAPTKGASSLATRATLRGVHGSHVLIPEGVEAPRAEFVACVLDAMLRGFSEERRQGEARKRVVWKLGGREADGPGYDGHVVVLAGGLRGDGDMPHVNVGWREHRMGKMSEGWRLGAREGKACWGKG